MKYSLKQKRKGTKAEDWPQGYFRKKDCRKCGREYAPSSPCNLYCTEECAEEARVDRYLERNYGISYADYLIRLEKQKDTCAICGGEGFVMDPSKHKVKLVVDHDHKTGNVRGLLCHNCNRALGLLKDNPDTIQTMLDYLEGATTISKESTLK